MNRTKTGLFAILCVVMIVMSMTSCVSFFLGQPGFNDWSYDDLPNGYTIWRVNCNTIELGKYDSNNSFERVIDNYILSFCHNDKYIGIKRAALDESLPAKDINEETINSSPVEFYLIDTVSDTVYGPYSLMEYQGKRKALNTGELGGWKKTVPKPDGAH